MRSLINKILEKCYNCLFPHHCIFCGQLSTRAQDICTPCLHDLPRTVRPCAHCGIALQLGETTNCTECIKNPPIYDHLYSLFSYETPITKLIMNLKFNAALSNARLLGECLAEHLIESYKTTTYPELIIPMPLHPSRIKERGFNQALEIARPIAKQLKVPITTTLCVRVRKTAAQATLAREDRLKNIQNAFRVTKNFSAQHVAILDDVITTGNTIGELCKMLKQHGVRKIDIWCCARAKP